MKTKPSDDELTVRNLAAAIADGSIQAEWDLGVAAITSVLRTEPVTDRPTALDIARARLAQRAERERVLAETGILIDDEDRVVFAHPLKLVTVPCFAKGCLYVATRATADAAVAVVEEHYRRKHVSRGSN